MRKKEEKMKMTILMAMMIGFILAIGIVSALDNGGSWVRPPTSNITQIVVNITLNQTAQFENITINNKANLNKVNITGKFNTPWSGSVLPYNNTGILTLWSIEGYPTLSEYGNYTSNQLIDQYLGTQTYIRDLQTGNTTIIGYMNALGFIGDGSRLIGLPVVNPFDQWVNKSSDVSAKSLNVSDIIYLGSKNQSIASVQNVLGGKDLMLTSYNPTGGTYSNVVFNVSNSLGYIYADSGWFSMSGSGNPWDGTSFDIPQADDGSGFLIGSGAVNNPVILGGMGDFVVTANPEEPSYCSKDFSFYTNLSVDGIFTVQDKSKLTSIQATTVNLTSWVRTNNGTRTIPAYAFTQDTNTGMFLNQSDKISFTTGGGDRLLVNNTDADFRVNISTKLKGANNTLVCVDTNGVLYRC